MIGVLVLDDFYGTDRDRKIQDPFEDQRDAEESYQHFRRGSRTEHQKEAEDTCHDCRSEDEPPVTDSEYFRILCDTQFEKSICHDENAHGDQDQAYSVKRVHQHRDTQDRKDGTELQVVLESQSEKVFREISDDLDDTENDQRDPEECTHKFRADICVKNESDAQETEDQGHDHISGLRDPHRSNRTHLHILHLQTYSKTVSLPRIPPV